jgi:hypothetical protein
MGHGFEIAFLIITTPAWDNGASELREYEERQGENIEYRKLRTCPREIIHPRTIGNYERIKDRAEPCSV